MLFNAETLNKETHTTQDFTVVAMYERRPEENPTSRHQKSFYLTLCFAEHQAADLLTDVHGLEHNLQKSITIADIQKADFKKYVAEELRRQDNILKVVRLYGPQFDKLKNG